MKKPGADFAFQPRNNISSSERPDFSKSPRKHKAHRDRNVNKLFGLETMVNERAPAKGPLHPINPNDDSQPAASREAGKPQKDPADGSPSQNRDPNSLYARFDALRVSGSSQSRPQATADSMTGARSESPDVVEISRPPAIKASALQAFFSDNPSRHTSSNPSSSTTKPVFGHSTQMMSSLKQKAANIFLDRKSRPEHHRDYKIAAPSVPIYQDRKPNPAMLFSSIAPDADLPSYRAPGNYGEPEFYTDPTKAAADLKALLEGGMDEEEEEKKEEGDDGTMEGLKVKLLPHQVEGVEWMRGRELGPVKRGKVPKGGILADDMGLGKTLQTISLILGNQKPVKTEKGWKKHFDTVEKTTLVVAPLALIRQWEQEIKEKVLNTHGLNVCVHHGPQRTKRFKDLAAYDVVITTYQVLVSEHGHCSEAEDGVKAGCFGLHWWRVVLDEAHTIKNRNAKSTKACYALRSEYRWCLSGTPMQNNLDELQSLIKFLRIKPYDDLKEWKDHIEKPLKQGKGHIAIRRLHSILRCFMKRRTKDILKVEGALNPGGKPTKEGEKSVTGFKVTERKIVSISAKFSPAERRFYDRLAARADESLERMLKGKVNYANALVLLLRLRQACNHPKLVEGKLDKDKDALAADASQKTDNVDIDSLADMLGGMGIVAKACIICGRSLAKNVKTDGDICDECFTDLAYFRNHEVPRSMKPKQKKGKVTKVVEEKVKVELKPKARRPRNRLAVIDSDDEEADATWLVGETERGKLRLGKAGGEEDENAEGGGEWLGKDDSAHASEDDDDGSQLKSFIVDDEVKGEEEYNSDDTFPSLTVIKSKVTRNPEDSDHTVSVHSSDIESSSEDDSGVDESELQSEDDRPRRKSQASQILASAKIRQLIQILHKEVYEHKFIVFSQFTSMLDLVEPFFRKEGFKFTRYDGGMKNDEREASLNRLRNDKGTRILLCSLKCGSLGLNLTAATRVVILEPFWNPFVEEQAIDRVHRLTQTVDVVVYKLTVENTVEERILELQEKKRLLAEHAIEGGMKKDAFKLGFKEMMELFKHDAHGSNDGTGEFGDDRVVADGLDFMAGLGSLRTKPIKKKENEVYGRRW